MPPALDHVVRKCLEKDPEDRWQSAHDVASELRWIGEAGSQAGVPTTLSVRRRSRERLAWVLAAAFAAAAAGGLAWALKLRRDVREADRLFRTDLVPPPAAGFAGVQAGAVVLSPDGQRLAYVAAREPQTQPRGARPRLGRDRRIAGTDGATFPFWSPDSRWLAFFAEGRLKKVEAAGGPVQVLCDAHAGRGGTWNREGTIVFAPDITGPLARVSAGGGTPTPATHTSDKSATHRNPWFLPDGRHFLFTAREGTALVGRVAVASLDGGEPKRLLEQGSNPQYAAGFLFAVVGGNLTAQPFDAGRQVLERQPVPIADALEYWNPKDLANFSVSQAACSPTASSVSGKRSWCGSIATGGSSPGWGIPRTTPPWASWAAAARRWPRRARTPRASNADVWILDLSRSQATRSTFLSAPGYIFGAVSPDGTRLAVSTASVGGRGRGDSLGPARVGERFTRRPSRRRAPSPSPSGRPTGPSSSGRRRRPTRDSTSPT